MPKEIYTYGFPKDQRWPEGVYPIALDASGDGTMEWPGGPIVVHIGSSAKFVGRVFEDRPGKLRTAVIAPPDKWVPPERHLAYFGRRITKGNEDEILDFARQERQA